MDVTSVVAANVKRIREQKKLTLDAAAEATDMSQSMLAQIEKGDVNPTISVLWKIANGYKVSFTSLVERENDTISVIRQEANGVLEADSERYRNYPVFPFDEKTLFETYRIVIEPSVFLAAEPHLNGSKEYITVFSGQAEIIVNGECIRLSEGDSARFRANAPHAYRNTGDAPAQLSMLIYYSR